MYKTAVYTIVNGVITHRNVLLTGFVNIMIFSKISKYRKYQKYHDIFDILDIFDTFKNAPVKRVGQLNKLLNRVKIVKHSIQHYLTCRQPRDLHCLQKKI